VAAISYNPPGNLVSDAPMQSMFAALYTGVGNIARFTLFFGDKMPGDYTGEIGSIAGNITRPTLSFIESNASFYGWANTQTAPEQYYPIILEQSRTIENTSAVDWPAITGWGMLRDNINYDNYTTYEAKQQAHAKNLIMFRSIPVAKQQPLARGDKFTLIGLNDPLADVFTKAFFIRLKLETSQV
jgi:hypothetical protein